MYVYRTMKTVVHQMDNNDLSLCGVEIKLGRDVKEVLNFTMFNFFYLKIWQNPHKLWVLEILFVQDEVWGRILGLKNGYCSSLAVRDNSQTGGQTSIEITDSSVPRK